MAAPAQTLLQPQVLTRVVSQKAAASDWLLNLFGLQPGGSNEVNLGHGRVGAFNIYNNVRTVGKGRAPVRQPLARLRTSSARCRLCTPACTTRSVCQLN